MRAQFRRNMLRPDPFDLADAASGQFSCPDLKEENRVTVSKSLAGEKQSIKLATLIAALFYDLSDKQVQIPKQGERRERELRELVKKGKRTIALFVDEAHDLNGHTLIGLKRLMEVIEDGDGRLSLILSGRVVRRQAGRVQGAVQQRT